MAATLDEVLTLAKSTHALSQEQLSRILALAPSMGVTDLERMKSMLMGVQEAEVKDMKEKITAHEKLAFFAAGQVRDEREKAETAEQLKDRSQADHLISNI